MKKQETMDGNQAAAYASYAFTEVAAIFPITPSSPMAEYVDEWSSRGMNNIFGQPVKVVEMQSEAGAAGAMHGSLQAGALTTSYTASQGLLLMIPNIYKWAGELLPGVLHVSARAIAAHALSIFGDHQDVMACRQTGAALLASSNVQEAMDLGCIAHLSSISSRLPFIHFFDGFRTSHEVQKIGVIDYEDLKSIADHHAIKEFRDRSLNPEHPVTRGTAQNPDIYFQGREAMNSFVEKTPGIVEKYMDEIYKITGRQYHLFDYYGAEDAQFVIVAMGSVCDTVSETVDHLMKNGEKVGLLKVRLYRPFSHEHFFNVLPKTVQKIAVLDRTKEPGSIGEPLYLDVVKSFYKSPMKPVIVGGRYGLGSKDTRPSQIISVFNNLKEIEPKDRFTIGITDDVGNTSLPEGEYVETTPEGTISCKFWGLGSDGTVGANKSAVKLIGDHTELYAQGYFSYDSKKSGGTTISHLRFGKYPIRSPYLVHHPNYIACHNKSFLNNYDILKGIKLKGIFVLNCPWNEKELEEHLPPTLKRQLALNLVDFYTIDAMTIASEIGLGNRINMIMQAAFFKLVPVISPEDAARYLHEAVEKMYGKKGEKLVEMNKTAIDRGMTGLVKVNVPEAWLYSFETGTENASGVTFKDVTGTFSKDFNGASAKNATVDFINRIQRPMARDEGDELPVSAFEGMEDGTFPNGTTAFEKRGIASLVPQWQMDNCIQCNQCSFICPHAVIRALLMDDGEMKDAPPSFLAKKAMGKGLESYQYKIQISALDCTGCGNCADVCPAPKKALIMKPAEEEIIRESENWEYGLKVSMKNTPLDKKTLKGSQFIKPLLEFNGACPGCGETPYVKLLTQLYGDRMMVANATGCSSIWAASAPSMAYSTDAQGRGPAWANSLFEDNAEFGYGMHLGVKQIQGRLATLSQKLMDGEYPASLKEAASKWLNSRDDGEASKTGSEVFAKALKDYGHPEDSTIHVLLDNKDYLVKKSIWILGGDGWAYDIGYGGLDHVLASGDDVNLFVLDTEIYSNTGGQASKATPTAAIAKFAASGKRVRKKDLGQMAMSYGYVYVAQIAMGANMNHAIKAIAEAESYKGPSLIIAYAPCISHGIRSGMGTSILHEKRAVAAGYWHLYRFDPNRFKEGKNPFQLDSGEPSAAYQEFIGSETRFSSLSKVFPEDAEEMFQASQSHALERYNSYRRLADMKYDS